MLFKLSNLNSNLALTLGYLNPALNNSALVDVGCSKKTLLKLSGPQLISGAEASKWATLIQITKGLSLIHMNTTLT